MLAKALDQLGTTVKSLQEVLGDNSREETDFTNQLTIRLRFLEDFARDYATNIRDPYKLDRYQHIHSLVTDLCKDHCYKSPTRTSLADLSTTLQTLKSLIPK